jgi:hypothetical protein
MKAAATLNDPALIERLDRMANEDPEPAIRDLAADMARKSRESSQPSHAVVSAEPSGRRSVNTEPLPGALTTVTSPPIMRASLRVIASPPRPVPNRENPNGFASPRFAASSCGERIGACGPQSLQLPLLGFGNKSAHAPAIWVEKGNGTTGRVSGSDLEYVSIAQVEMEIGEDVCDRYSQ